MVKPDSGTPVRSHRVLLSVLAIAGMSVFVLLGSAIVFSVPGVRGSCGGTLPTGRTVESYTDNLLGTSMRAYGDGAVINSRWQDLTKQPLNFLGMRARGYVPIPGRPAQQGIAHGTTHSESLISRLCQS